MKIKVLLLFLGLYCATALSQNFSVSQNTKISVLTVDVANESHTLYGHTAIRVTNPATNFDYVYNYGMFDFGTSNFILKFIKGDLQYYAAAYPFADFEYTYQLENRSIYQQELLLSVSEKQKIINSLNYSLLEKNKYYTYKFIDRNCTTKVIDVINANTSKSLIKNTLHKTQSYREVLFPYANNHYYMQLGINIIFGIKTDQQAASLFLPLDLKKVLTTTQHNQQPFVAATKTIFKATDNSKFSFLDSIYSFILILAFILVIPKKISTVIYFLLLGLMGCLFTAIGFYSLHAEVLWNYNILLFNPLFLFLVYAIIKNNTQQIKTYTRVCFAILIIYTVLVLFKVYVFLVLPIIIATAIQLYRVNKRFFCLF